MIDRSEIMIQRIAALPYEARSALAVAVAQRLMAEHLELAENTRSPFTISLAPVVRLLGNAIDDPSLELDRMLEDSLNNYYAGPYCHQLGEDALPGADEDAASAAIYALIAYVNKGTRDAAFAALQLVDAVTSKVDAICLENQIDAMSKQADGIRTQLEDLQFDHLDLAVSHLERSHFTRNTLSELLKILNYTPS